MHVAFLISAAISMPEWLVIVLLAIVLVIWVVLTWISTSGQRWP